MDCDRVRDLLSAYVGEELADGEFAAVSTHLDGCARCAAEAAGFAETLALLAALPRETAPPELLDRVMKGIAAESAAAPARKRLFSSPRVRISVEAAAAVFLLVLVYGVQKGIPLRSGIPERGSGSPPAASLPAPAVSMPPPVAAPTARYARKEPPTAAGSGKATRPIPERGSPQASMADSSGEVPAAGSTPAESRDAGSPPASGATESRETAAPIGRAAPGLTPGPAFAVAPAVRVSSEEEAIEPKVFAAPPSRLLRPLPYGRDVTLEVTPAEREGLEVRIVGAAERLGGGAHPGAAFRAESGQAPLSGAVRVHLPVESAAAFLDALKSFGTIAPEGMPAAADLPAGPSPGVVAYTVRIRVR